MEIGSRFYTSGEKESSGAVNLFCFAFCETDRPTYGSRVSPKNLNLTTRLSVPVSLENSVEISATRQLYFSPISSVLNNAAGMSFLVP